MSTVPQYALKKLLEQVLATGHSDAAVERLFSIAGDIQRPKRATLQKGILCDLLIVKYGDNY